MVLLQGQLHTEEVSVQEGRMVFEYERAGMGSVVVSDVEVVRILQEMFVLRWLQVPVVAGLQGRRDAGQWFESGALLPF